MRIEVTEKEAMLIYSERYLRQRRRKFYVVAVAFGVLAALAFFITGYYISSDWLAAASACLLLSPIIYKILRDAHNSGKYARRMIREGQE